MVFTTPKKKKNILIQGGKSNTPFKEILSPNSKLRLKKLGVEYNPDNKFFCFNPKTGSPHSKKSGHYKAADFKLIIEIIDAKTEEIKKHRVFKIFVEKEKIISIAPDYKKQKKLEYSTTKIITKKDLIKSNKVNPHLTGKNKTAKQIVEELKIEDKLPYKIGEKNRLELLHIIAKIFSGFKIATQNIKNTFPGIRPANINQRSIIETPTKKVLEKNITKAVKYTIELYQCEPKLQRTKNTERPHLGDWLIVSAEYRLIEDPDVIFKYSVEMPVFKTILLQNNKGKDDGDKYFRKIFNIMFKKLHEHYGKSVLSVLNFNNVSMQRERKKKKNKRKLNEKFSQSPVPTKKRKLMPTEKREKINVNLFRTSFTKNSKL